MQGCVLEQCVVAEGIDFGTTVRFVQPPNRGKTGPDFFGYSARFDEDGSPYADERLVGYSSYHVLPKDIHRAIEGSKKSTALF